MWLMLGKPSNAVSTDVRRKGAEESLISCKPNSPSRKSFELARTNLVRLAKHVVGEKITNLSKRVALLGDWCFHWLYERPAFCRGELSRHRRYFALIVKLMMPRKKVTTSLASHRFNEDNQPEPNEYSPEPADEAPTRDSQPHENMESSDPGGQQTCVIPEAKEPAEAISAG